MKHIDISIIIVSNNHKVYLEKCLSSIFKYSTPLNVEVLIVDNASGDDTSQYTRENFPAVVIIRRKQKRGYAANNNLAIKRSRGQFILLLNSDTEVTSRALQHMFNFMKTHKEAGICGPQLRFPDGSLQLSCRAFPTWKSVIVRRTPLRLFLKNSSLNTNHLLIHINHRKTQTVDWLLGACLMIRRDVFKTVGFFDEHFFLYVEDIDFCFRTWQCGWQVYYVPEALVVHHHLAVSDKKLFSLYSYHHWKSMLYYFIKHILRKAT